MYLRHLIRHVIIVSHYLYWSYRFYSFGWHSRVYHCDMLTNPKAISIGKNVTILKHARLEAVDPWDGREPKICIGDGTSAQFYFHCGAAKSVTIGKNVLISGNVYITDHDHVFSDPNYPPRLSNELNVKPVVIEDGVWLGEGCSVLKGVTIGLRSVVGANAVVTKDVPPFTVVGGVPARVIRKIDRCSRQER